MVLKSPAYYRARLEVINLELNRVNVLIDQDGTRDELKMYRVLLRNGVIPENLIREYGYANEYNMITDWMKENKYDSKPLLFTEVTSFNTWFQMHPEKVAGNEWVTTSIHFPVSIKGTKDDIIKTVDPSFQEKADDTEFTYLFDKLKKENPTLPEDHPLMVLDKNSTQFRQALLEYYNAPENNKRLRIAKTKAKAKLKLLQLLKM